MNVLSIGFRRTLALVLALAMLLSLACNPAMAEEDWQQLVIMLSYNDIWGTPCMVQAVPVENGYEHAFWAIVPAEALTMGMRVSAYHPWYSYTFSPDENELLTNVQDSGLVMNQELAVPLYAFSGDQLADVYMLYISTQVLPGLEQPDVPQATEEPVQIPDAVISVLYRDEMGGLLYQESAQIPAGGSQTFYAMSFDGYDLLSTDSVTLYVDAMGYAQPGNTVEFFYRQKPVNLSAEVPVHFRTESNEVLAEDVVTASQDAPATVYAIQFDGYELVSDQSVTVTVDGNGTAWPSEVVFTYRRVPVSAVLNVYYMTLTGEMLGGDTYTVQEGSPVLVEAKPFAGYVVNGSSQMGVSIMGGVLAPDQVTFFYEPEPMTTASVDVVYRTAEGAELNRYQIMVTEGAPVTETAQAEYNGYRLVGEGSAVVSVDHSGVVTPGEVTFIYELIPPTTASVDVVYRTAEGAELNRYQIMVTEGAPVTETAQAEYNGYRLAGEGSAVVSVDHSGVVTPGEVTFIYELIPPTTASVDVVYRTAEGAELNRYQLTVTEGMDYTETAPAQYKGYQLASDAYVTVSVDHSGVVTPGEVVFTYQEIMPAAAVVNILFQTDDGQVLEQVSVTVIEGNPNVISAKEYDGYRLTSADQVSVVVLGEGLASPETVTFVYSKLAAATPAPTETPEPTAVPLANVVVRYVNDWDGTDLTEPTLLQNLQDGVYPISAAPVSLPEHYELVSGEQVVLTVSGGMADPAEIVFRYQYAEPVAPETPTPAPTEIPLAGVTVRYVDAYTGLDLVEPTLMNNLTDGHYTVTADPVGLPESYVLLDENQVQVTVRDGVAMPASIMFVYEYMEPATPTPTTAPTATPEPVVTAEPTATIEPTATPTAAPVTAEVVVHYLDSNGKAILPDQTVVLGAGTHMLSPDPYLVPDDYDLYSAAAKEVKVNDKGKAEPKQVTFRLALEVPELGELINRFGKTTTKVNLRSEPTKKSDAVVSGINKDSAVWMIERVPGTADAKEIWVRVLYQGKNGYIMEQYLSMMSQADSDAQQEKLVNKGHTAVPAQSTPAPATNAPVIETITPTPAAETPVVITAAPATEDPVVEIITPAPATEEPVIEIITPVPVTEAPAIITPVSATEAPVIITPVPATEAPVIITPVPATEAPVIITTVPVTEAPVIVTAMPTDVPTPTPTMVPEQYHGYALVSRQTELRDGVNAYNSSVITMLDVNTLVSVEQQVFQNGEAWSRVTTLDGMSGFVRHGELIQITSQEAQLYQQMWEMEHPTPSPVPSTATSEPMQYQGYFVTVGDNVPFRNMPNDRSVMLALLDRNVTVFVTQQVYDTEDGWVWHYVQYGGMMGFIRSDMLRMMTDQEIWNYLNSTVTPEPTTQATQPPYDVNSLSGYGYVYTANSGRINVRQQPSVEAKQVNELRNFALCLVLNKMTVGNYDWYYIDYNGQRGYVRGDLFKQLTLAQLEDFMDSAEYQQGLKNNQSSSTSATNRPNEIVTLEEQNVTVWTNPQSGLDITYATWVPMATVAPLPTETPAPEASPTIGYEPYITPDPAQQTMPAVTDQPTVIETEQPDSFPFGLIGLGALGIVGAGAAYMMVLMRRNKRLAAQRSAQRAAVAQRKAQQQANVQPAARTGSYAQQKQPAQAQRPTPPVRQQQTAAAESQPNYRFAQNRPQTQQEAQQIVSTEQKIHEPVLKTAEQPLTNASYERPAAAYTAASVRQPVNKMPGAVPAEPVQEPVQPQETVLSRYQRDMAEAAAKANEGTPAPRTEQPAEAAAKTVEAPAESTSLPETEQPAAAETKQAPVIGQGGRTRRTQRNAANYDEADSQETEE